MEVAPAGRSRRRGRDAPVHEQHLRSARRLVRVAADARRALGERRHRHVGGAAFGRHRVRDGAPQDRRRRRRRARYVGLSARRDGWRHRRAAERGGVVRCDGAHRRGRRAHRRARRTRARGRARVGRGAARRRRDRRDASEDHVPRPDRCGRASRRLRRDDRRSGSRAAARSRSTSRSTGSPSSGPSPASIPTCTAARSCSPRRSTTSRARSRTRFRAAPRPDPFADICIPSVFDDSLAPEGHHIVSMFTQWVPHEWASKPDANGLDAYADRVIARVEEVAPGFTGSILHRQVIGPYEMEHEYGLVGGNIFHGELSPGTAVPHAARAGLRRLPHADRRPLPGEQRDPRRRRRHRHPGHERRRTDRARSPARTVAACVARALAATLLVFAAVVPLGRRGGVAGAAADPVRLTVGVIGPIGSIDITNGTSDAAREIWKLQYPTLTAFSARRPRDVPGVADAWTANADGHGYTYTVGPATWSDGSPVTAADVVASLQRARDEHWPYAAGMLDDLDARVVDDRTVAITTTRRHRRPADAARCTSCPTNGDTTLSAGDFVVADANERRGSHGGRRPPGAAGARRDRVPLLRAMPRALEDALAGGDVDIAAGFGNGDLADVRAIDGGDGDPQQRRRPVVRAGPRRRPGAPAGDRACRSTATRSSGTRSAVSAGPRSRRSSRADSEWQLDDDEVQALAEELRYAPDDARTLVEQLGSAPTLTLAAPDDDVGGAIADSVVTVARRGRHHRRTRRRWRRPTSPSRDAIRPTTRPRRSPSTRARATSGATPSTTPRSRSTPRRPIRRSGTRRRARWCAASPTGLPEIVALRAGRAPGLPRRQHRRDPARPGAEPARRLLAERAAVPRDGARGGGRVRGAPGEHVRRPRDRERRGRRPSVSS